MITFSLIFSQDILLDCDQSNVLLPRIIFLYSLKNFFVLSACIGNPVFNTNSDWR